MRRALCVGIDQYGFGPLTGCVNDAQRMTAVLEKQQDGSPNFDCKTLIAPQGGGDDLVTCSILGEHLEMLFKDPADVALFHFSGHGTINNLDGYLVTQDAKKYSEGMAMGNVLKFANESKAREVVILLDCCFSGQLGNLPAIDNTKVFLREGISILTAGRGNQVSVEAGGGGVSSLHPTPSAARSPIPQSNPLNRPRQHPRTSTQTAQQTLPAGHGRAAAKEKTLHPNGTETRVPS